MMRGKAVILAIILCLLITSCATPTIADIAPSPMASTQPTATPKPTPSPTLAPPLPTPDPTPIPPSFFSTDIPDVDTSYVDDTIRPSYLVFDDTHMYYIDGMVIKKRHVETGETEVIFEGVYDNYYLCLQDGWLYLYTKGKGIIKVKTDGTAMEVVRNIQAKRVLAAGHDIYFLFTCYPGMDDDSLTRYNTKNKEIQQIDHRGYKACYENKILYFSCWDNTQWDIVVYDTDRGKKTTHFSSEGMPAIKNNKAYFQYYNWDKEKLYLSVYDSFLSETEELKEDHRYIDYEYFYYNYLVGAKYGYCQLYDIKTGRDYTIPTDGYALDLVSHKNKLYVVSIAEINYEEELPTFTMSEMQIHEGSMHVIKQWEVKNNSLFHPEESTYIELSDLTVNEEWDEVALLSPHDQIEDIIYDDKCYSYYWKTGMQESSRDGTSSKILLQPDDIYGSDEFDFCICGDNIYYFDITIPILRSYNIKTGKIKEYGELSAYPYQVKKHGQYLIFDSYYNGYCYGWMEDMYKTQRHALNMETGEIIQLEPEHPN